MKKKESIKLIDLLYALDKYLWYASPSTPSGDLDRKEKRLSNRMHASLKAVSDGKLIIQNGRLVK